MAIQPSSAAPPPRPPNAAYPPPEKCDHHRHVCILDMVPNDSRWSEQYGPQITRAPAAWDYTRGSSTVVIAIIDTGVNCLHEDLIGKCVPGFDFIHGIPLSGLENSDDYGHGTHVAGIAAANTNNATGIAGECWYCLIMPVKVCMADTGYCPENLVTQGLMWAADHGAKIANLSLGTAGNDFGMAVGVDYAYAHGVLVVAACGNDLVAPCNYPAQDANAMAVSCSDINDAFCAFSSFGDVDVAAPGAIVLSTLPTAGGVMYDPSGYGRASGTSMSVPHVAGVAGLIRSQHPEYSVDQVWGLLQQSAADKGTPGPDDRFGFGRVDAFGAVTQPAPAGRLSQGGSIPTPVPGITPIPCRTNPQGKCVGRR